MISESNIRLMFLIAVTGVAGSIFFSEILKFPPCELCWYQRMCLFPIAVILSVALWKSDQKIGHYILPFIAAGLLISAYHNLLYFGIIPEAISPCTQGVSCTAKQLEIFGFLTIPLMSLISFSLLGFLAIPSSRRKSEKK